METISFMSSLLTFYLKGEVAFEQNYVRLTIPNTILSLIPLGSRNKQISTGQIASVETNFKLRMKDFLVGLIVAFIGLSFFNDTFIGGLIFLIIGVGMCVSAFQTSVVINENSGQNETINFVVIEKAKAEQMAAQVNALISSRMDDTNVARQTDRSIDASASNTAAIIDAIKASKE
jgi:hypothetical protein